MTAPRFSCALSLEVDSRKALRTALDELDAGLDGETPHLVVAFVTHHHGELLETVGPQLERATGAPVVMGCTAESVIGAGREAEGRPGVSLFAAYMPGTTVRFFEATATAGEAGEPRFSSLPPVEDPERDGLILVADPFTFPADAYLRELDAGLPGVSVMGGMASGAQGPGQTLLFTADGVRESGCVGICLSGGIEIQPVVSQGCRPIGAPWVITDCEKNRIKKLGGRAALEVLMETWHGLSPEDQKLLQSAPFLGLAIDPTRSEFQRDDFLVRGIMGLHQRDRSIAVADFVRRGQTVQLLIRDAASAGEDLELSLARHAGRVPGTSACATGALLFSCNGRGSRMFPEPHHDVSCVRRGLHEELPVAGFFAAGEIGPVGGKNFLHGFTASVAVLRERAEA